MRSYDLIEDYFGRAQGQAGQNIPDLVSTVPEWVIAVVRLRYPMTYQRSQRASFSTFFPDAVDTRGKTLIITDDCIQLQTSSQKGNHLTSMTATLVAGQNYLNDILPGDYVMAWILNEKELAADLVKRIRNGEACNKFMDGLKFMGKVQTLRKKLTQSSEGTRTVRYTLSGVGFSEFDSNFYYNPHLAEQIPAIGRYFGRIAQSFNQLVDQTNQIDVNKAIPFFVDLLLGRGVPANLGRGGGDDPALRSTAGLEAPYSYIVPQTYGSLIGKTTSSKQGGALAYADMLELVTGVQSFGDASTPSQSDQDADASAAAKGAIFTPDGPTDGSRRYTGTQMMGRFTPQIPQFENATVWSVLSQYLNSACNEMFVALRTNGDGNVVPTLTVRQLPFSSGLINLSFPLTRFLDLPRWRVHPGMVKEADVGRSDTLRWNFVHVLGVAPAVVGKNDLTGQTVRNPPLRDDLDIARSGLRNYSTTIPCAFADVAVKTGTTPGSTAASNWMDLLADMLMGQHLTLTGYLTITGVQAPICIGDNLEWDGVVFHIESVTHSAQMNSDGKKSFSTTVTLSHGMRTNPGEDDITLYAGIKDLDQTAFEPVPVTESFIDPQNQNEEIPNTGDVKAARDKAFADKTAEAQGPITPTDAASIFGSIH